MICKKCNISYDNDISFCTQCGNELKEPFSVIDGMINIAKSKLFSANIKIYALSIIWTGFIYFILSLTNLGINFFSGIITLISPLLTLFAFIKISGDSKNLDKLSLSGFYFIKAGTIINLVSSAAAIIFLLIALFVGFGYRNNPIGIIGGDSLSLLGIPVQYFYLFVMAFIIAYIIGVAFTLITDIFRLKVVNGLIKSIKTNILHTKGINFVRVSNYISVVFLVFLAVLVIWMTVMAFLITVLSNSGVSESTEYLANNGFLYFMPLLINATYKIIINILLTKYKNLENK